ncbi:uncharacterized protein LOC129598270 [Paramacrobiotus metropolitanus]|uniref:uncharacterized protein LOC129598270 n=1 Tax=Paramacrobiotus metropolitanus TaxID=2943436 RepID=UPI0024456208|nr:uncharacterized protein LOC129598270 [Paramacrobiotus metropolitanus]XP_055352063.1 uncharacterized protein LOC129598270 [Paramacrobiotus metropolitanus]
MTRIRWKVSNGGRIQIGNKYRKSAVDLPKNGVEKWTFVKRTIRLPESHPGTVTTARLQQRFTGMTNRHQYYARAVCVGVVDRCLVYIQRRSDAGAEPDDNRMTSELRNLRRFHKALLGPIKRKPLVQIAAVNVLALLPTELWTEVFSNLGTVSQTRLRPVCATWDAILSSACLTANVVFDTAAFSEADRKGYLSSKYFLVSVLFKCLSSSTQHVAVVDQENRTRRMHILEVCGIFNYLTAQHIPGLS